MKKTKIILLLTALGGGLIAIMYFLLFTTAEVPASLVQPTDSAGKPSGERRTALVLKPIRPHNLKPGDLILVEIPGGNQPASTIQKLQKVQWPDESERSKVPQGRRPRSRRVAQAILDMDFKPEYWISSADEADPAGLARVEENQIKGKVIHTFTKK